MDDGIPIPECADLALYGRDVSFDIEDLEAKLMLNLRGLGLGEGEEDSCGRQACGLVSCNKRIG